MVAKMQTGAVHHLRLTVTDVGRAREFYTGVLGFQVAIEWPTAVILTNGSMLLGLGPSPYPERAIRNDRFDENRVGLDHLSFTVPDRDALVSATQRLDERGVPHGEIEDLGTALGVYALTLRDPDNIQLELSAPYR